MINDVLTRRTVDGILGEKLKPLIIITNFKIE